MNQFLIVIPAYNEGDRLKGFLPFLTAELRRLEIPARVLVVDDGSAETESRAMQTLCQNTRSVNTETVEYLKLEKNYGKGGAVYAGWNRAETESLLVFVDADGSISPEETARILNRAAESPEKAHFASRVKMRGKKIFRAVPRHWMGRIFASLVGAFIDPEIYDSQCGFKIIPINVYKKIVPLLREDRFAFDIELLSALNYVGCPVIEHPIDWKEVSGSKVSLISDTLQMACAIFTISRRAKSWRYNKR